MLTNADQTVGTGEEALKAMRVIFAAIASSQIGTMITIPGNRA